MRRSAGRAGRRRQARARPGPCAAVGAAAPTSKLWVSSQRAAWAGAALGSLHCFCLPLQSPSHLEHYSNQSPLPTLKGFTKGTK